MNNTIKIILLIIGVGLVGYGVYQILTPDVQGEIFGLEFSANDDKIRKESIILIVLGLIAIISTRIAKRKS